MIKKEEILNNINIQYGITKEFLRDSKYGLCRYISDICSNMEL
jgi:hypothetical protein